MQRTGDVVTGVRRDIEVLRYYPIIRPPLAKVAGVGIVRVAVGLHCARSRADIWNELGPGGPGGKRQGQQSGPNQDAVASPSLRVSLRHPDLNLLTFWR